MISTEKAFDLLPYVSDIYEKVDIETFLKNQQKVIKEGEKNEITTMKFGLDMFSYILKQSHKIKEEFFNIVAIIEEKELAEVKSQPFPLTLKTIKGLYEDKDTMDFLKSVI